MSVVTRHPRSALTLRSSTLLLCLLACSMFALLVGGLRPIIPLSELGGELWTYFALPFIVAAVSLAIRPRRFYAPSTKRLIAIHLPFFAVGMAVSIINLPLVLGDGLPKFSGAVVVYLFSFFYAAGVTSFLDRRGLWEGLLEISKIATKVGWLAVAIGSFELAGWFLPPAREALVSLKSLYSVRPQGELARLTGLTYEPSYFAAVLICLIPWIVYYRSVTRSRSALLLLVSIFAIGLIGGARTALVGYTAILCAISFSAIFGGMRFYRVLVMVFVVTLMVIGPIIPFIIYDSLSIQSSVSDITRSSFASAAVTAGLHEPFGHGIGQANATALQYYQPSGYSSWEIDAFLLGVKSYLPPVYSWYGRVIAEAGIIGYICLCALLLSVLYRCGRLARRHAINSNLYRVVFCSLTSFLAIGLSTETFRDFSWLTFLITSSALLASGQQPQVNSRAEINQ